MFRAKRQYVMPPRSRLGFREKNTELCEGQTESQIFFLTCFVYRIASAIISLIYDNAFKKLLKAFDDFVFISLKLTACHICLFLSGLICLSHAQIGLL